MTGLRNFVIVLLILARWCHAATSITMYSGESGELTWTFDSDYTVGYFVDGQPWVLDPGSGVTISSATPTPSSTRNISRVNPAVGSGAFDSRADGYSATGVATFPLVLNAGESLVSTVSIDEGGNTVEDASYPSYWGGEIGTHCFVRSSAVLTCVASAPAANSFRPPWFGSTNKVPVHTTADVDDSFLLDLDAGGNAPSLADSERAYERPWTSLHMFNFQARESSPHQNMRSYHREVGTTTSIAAMLLLTDVGESKSNLLNLMVQNGLDHYYLFNSGSEGSSSAYKISVLIAGLALDNSTILGVFGSGNVNVPSGYGWPRDRDKFYFWDDRPEAATPGTGVTTGETYTGATVFFTKEWEDTYEHLPPDEWPASGCADESGYRKNADSYPHVGMVLCAQILDNTGNGTKANWNWDAAFAYVDRWMTEDMSAFESAIEAACGGDLDPADYQTSNSTFVDYMYSNFRYYSESGAGNTPKQGARQNAALGRLLRR